MSARKLLVCTSLLVAFCIAAPGVAAAKQSGTERPVKGSGSSTTTIDLTTLGSTTEGTAIISHLGKTTLTQSFTITPTGPLAFNLTGGTATFVAANGDQLFATITGSGTQSAPGVGVGITIDVDSVFAITGGTGRFADASGRLTVPIDVTIVSLVGTTVGTSDTFTLRGQISY